MKLRIEKHQGKYYPQKRVLWWWEYYYYIGGQRVSSDTMGGAEEYLKFNKKEYYGI